MEGDNNGSEVGTLDERGEHYIEACTDSAKPITNVEEESKRETKAVVDGMDESSKRAKLKKKLKMTTFHFSCIFFFTFFACSALEVFQSSVNFDEGLGTFSLSLLYSTYAASALLIGPAVVTLVKPKWTLFISLFPHTLFIIANVFPTWATMLTSSALLGIVSPLIWITQGTYINNVALNYAEVSDQALEHILPKFMGFFFLVSGLSNPAGTLVASVVLQYTRDYNGTCSNLQYNDTKSVVEVFNTTTSPLQLTTHTDMTPHPVRCGKNTDVCGPSHCPYMDEHLEVLQRPDDLLIYILMGVFLLSNVTAIVMCLFLPSVTAPVAKRTVREKLRSTCQVLRKVDMWLLIPIFFFCGIMPASIFSTFTQSFVSCTFGVGMVGYVMMVEGLAYSIISFIAGSITNYVPRNVQMTVGALVMIGLTTGALLWQPTPDDLWIIFILMIICGFSHGGLEIHINALTSLLFSLDPEAAFGQMHVWQSIGYVVGFGYSSLLCFNIKAYCLIASTVLLLVCNTLIEIRLRRRKQNTEEKPVEEIPIKSVTT